ncbi:MAG: potassium transporter TrkG, partial [Phycisphaerae bacterium]
PLHILANALFQSVTSRTAGFNTVPIGSLSTPALLVLGMLMFIGGSPASCAGGIKTTSVAAWYAQLRAWLTGRRDVILMGRRLPGEIVARAGMIIGLGVIWIAVGSIVLTVLESGRTGMSFERLLFEQVSAFGTVGLSTGITSSLTAGSRIWIILSMFVGRIGPLAFAMVISQQETDYVRYPEEHLMVG